MEQCGAATQRDDEMKIKAYLDRKVYLTLPGTGKKTVRVPVKARPLRQEWAFYRTRADVEQGIQGECGTCANAIGAVRSGLCELAQFTDSRAYLVSKFNKQGVPTECVVGEHDQGGFQKRFDKNKKALLKSDECEGIVKIKPFDPTRHRNPAKYKPTGPHASPSATHIKRARGAAARAQRAGIVRV
jgi:hypothetical protein